MLILADTLLFSFDSNVSSWFSFSHAAPSLWFDLLYKETAGIHFGLSSHAATLLQRISLINRSVVTGSVFISGFLKYSEHVYLMNHGGDSLPGKRADKRRKILLL